MTRSQSWETKPILIYLAFVIIFLLAAFLRLHRLDEIPPGLTHDEADTAYFCAAVYRGARSPVEAPYGYAYEPLPMYTGALFMALFGPTGLALRFHSAFFGLVLLVFTYLWAKHIFGPAVGLGSAALIGASFWTVCDSRFALNSQPAPALFTGAVYFLWLALDDDGPDRPGWAWGLFILMLTGALYVYEAARAAALAFGLLFVYLACFDRRRFRRHGAWFAGALVAVGVLAAPHLLDPGAWGRTSTLSGPLQAAAQGDLRPLWNNVLGALGAFSLSGDSLITYNLPGRPIFDPVVSLFFYAGLLLCIWRWKRLAYAFLLMWLAAGLSPTLALGKYTSTLHSKVAEAPIMILPALSAVALWRGAAARWRPCLRRAFALAGVTWLSVVTVSTGYDYFLRWGESPATRAAYFHNLAAITDYVNEAEYDESIVMISSPFPDLPLDPLIAEARVRRDTVSLRWCDAQRAILLPDATHSLLIVPPNAPLAPYFAQQLDLQLVERVRLRPDDVDPYFDVFTWNPNAALSRFSSSSFDTVGMVSADGERLPLPVNFGGAVELVAYTRPGPKASPGTDAALITVWRVRDPAALGPPPAHDYGRAAVIFVHALDETDAVVGQEDRLDAPAWNWRAGDTFVQLHRFRIAIDAPPGPYHLAVGLYRRDDLARLPVIVNGVEIDDHIRLDFSRKNKPSNDI